MHPPPSSGPQALAELQAHLDQAAFGAVLLLDLNRFGRLRTGLGPATAHAIVEILDSRLRASTRDRDILRRTGDDRFVVVASGLTHLTAARALARRLLLRVREPVQVEDHVLHLEARVGMTFFPADGSRLDDLIRQAEVASNTDTVGVYQPGQGAVATEKLTLIQELHQALKVDDLDVVYQPIVSAKDGGLVGAEALARWTSPSRGAIDSGRLAALAEEGNLAALLTERVIARAAAQIVPVLPQLPSRFRLSLNLSGSELADPERADVLLALLRNAGLPPEHVQLEITEGALMREVRSAVQVLTRLRKAGVAIAVDDFGTGYSSLAYLAELPVQTLKIDALFLRDLPAPSARALLQAIVAVGRALDLAVICEGVERPDQLEACRQLPVDHLQGFAFGRPDTVATLLGRERSRVAPLGHPTTSPESQARDTEPLPLLPTTLAALWSAGPDVDADTLAALCASDAALAVALLDFVHAQGRPPPRRTPSVRELVVQAGASPFARAILAPSHAKVVLPSPAATRGLWRHSVLVATWARIVGRARDLPGDGWLPGLLHDVGRLVLMDARAPDIERLEATGWHTPEELHTLEQRLLHVDHAELGAVHARRRRWPPDLVAAILHHHREDDLRELPEDHRALVDVIRVADRLALLVEEHPALARASDGAREAAIRSALPGHLRLDLPMAVLARQWPDAPGVPTGGPTTAS